MRIIAVSPARAAALQNLQDKDFFAASKFVTALSRVMCFWKKELLRKEREKKHCLATLFFN